MAKGMGSRGRQTWAMWPWIRYSTSPSPGFRICKMGLLINFPGRVIVGIECLSVRKSLGIYVAYVFPAVAVACRAICDFRAALALF